MLRVCGHQIRLHPSKLYCTPSLPQLTSSLHLYLHPLNLNLSLDRPESQNQDIETTVYRPLLCTKGKTCREFRRRRHCYEPSPDNYGSNFSPPNKTSKTVGPKFLSSPRWRLQKVHPRSMSISTMQCRY